MSRLAKLTQKVKPGKKAKSKKSSDTGKLLKVEDYKGYQMHINEIVNNPNGQKSQTVLIYKDEKPVGSAFADLQFENAIEKAKSKIDNYFAKGGETGFFTKEGVLDKEYYNTFTLAGNGKRKYNIFQSHNDRQLRQAAKKLFPGMAYTEHLSRAKYMKEKAQEFMDKYIKSVEDNFKKEFGRPVEPTDYKVSGIWTNDFSESAKKEITENLSKYNDYKSALNFHNAVLNKKDKQEYTYAKGGRTHAAIAADKDRKAMHPGRRVSADGSVYYENRANRSDADRRKKFESGGPVPKNKVRCTELPGLLKNMGVRMQDANQGNDNKCYIDVEEQFWWGAKTQKEYNNAQKEIDNIKFSGKGWNVYAWYDISSFEYWMKQEQEQNYIQITLSTDEFVDKNQTEKIYDAIDNSIAAADAIANKYSYNPSVYEEGGEVPDDLLEFTIPNWALSALINADESGLTDEEQEKLNEFVEQTVEEYGNAIFMLPEEEKADLGFRWRNDIDGALGGDCHLLYLRPSKEYDSGGFTEKSPNPKYVGAKVFIAYPYRKKWVVVDEKTNSLWSNELFSSLQEAKDFIEDNKFNLIDQEVRPFKQEYKYAKGGTTEDDRVEEILRHYVTAALWSSSDIDKEDEMLDANYSFEDVSPELLDRFRADIKKFITENDADIKEVGLTDEQVGHSLWLSQNRHGAGFFDYSGEEADRLQKEAIKLGSHDLYAGNDGKIYSLNSGVNKSSYAAGGKIKNQYEGKNVMQVWSAWSNNQRSHFLYDHFKKEITPASIEEYSKKNYQFLPKEVKDHLAVHIVAGQYAKGGSTVSASSIIEKYKGKINSRADIKAFFVDLYKMDIAFHPDDDFADIVNLESDKHVFSKKEAADLNKIMQECFAWSENNNEDLYEISISVQVPEFVKRGILPEESMYQLVRLSVDGSETTLAEFIEQNEEMDTKEIDMIKNLKPGESYFTGHAGSTEIKRLEDAYAKGGMTDDDKEDYLNNFFEVNFTHEQLMDKFDYLTFENRDNRITTDELENYVNNNLVGTMLNKHAPIEYVESLKDLSIYAKGGKTPGRRKVVRQIFEEEEFDYASGGKAGAITAADEGNWVDGNRGIYQGEQIISIAERYGFVVKEEDQANKKSDGEFYYELVDEAIEYLNELAPEGYYFGNTESGDFGLWKTEDEEFARGGRTRAAIAADKDRKAMHPGRRVSASGNVYHENRANHSDADRRRKFAKGGNMEKTQTLSEYVQEKREMGYSVALIYKDDVILEWMINDENDGSWSDYRVRPNGTFIDKKHHDFELLTHSGNDVNDFISMNDYRKPEPGDEQILGWFKNGSRKLFAAGGSTGDLKTLHNGRYLTFATQGGKLHIFLTDEGREWIKENGPITYQNFWELFDDITGNSELLYFNDIGDAGFGLTSAPGFTDGYFYNDKGELEEHESGGNVWWFEPYQVIDPWKELTEKGEVDFDGTEGNKLENGGQLEVTPKDEFARGGRTHAAIAADKDRKAMHPGRRVSSDGKVYYENRPNRSDADRRRKFAAGGDTNSDTVLIYSSHGEIMADKKTGLVKEVVRYEGSELPENITKIDLEEYKKYHKVDLIPDSIDILDVGFWYDENKYEEPEQDWREREFARGGRTRAAIAADKDRKAMHPGRRVSADGNVYYENRANRSDADRRRKFAAGGLNEGGYSFLVRPVSFYNRGASEREKFYLPGREGDDDGLRKKGYVLQWSHIEGGKGAKYFKDREAANIMKQEMIDKEQNKKFAAGGQIGSGKNGYIAFYKGKQVEVLADTSYQAQETAAKHFKARKSYEVTVVLAEKDGKQVSHIPDFARGGQAVSKDVLLPNDDNPEGFAKGGDVDSDIILLESVDKMITEDNYHEGENPDTTRSVFYESEMKEFKNYSELFDYLNRNYGLSSDPKHYLAFEDGRLTYNQTEDAEGSKASESEMARFKKGLINLYTGDYNIYLSRIKKSTITTDEMAKWGAEKYEKGGQAYANGGTTGKPEMIIRHKENGKFDLLNPDGSMFKDDVSSVIAARQHAIDAGFGFREEKNTRKEGIYSIQKAAHDGQDITEMVKAYGPSFIPDLLSSIEEQYASGHSMRYSILRDVVKNIRFDASDNRIPNTEAQPYVENMIPFKGNNLEGKRTDNGDYVVLSFGHYPIWYYNARAKKWYGNADKYSQVTAMHISQTRPNWEAEIIAHPDLLKQMRTDETKFECGGMLQNLFEVPYPNISVASSGLQGVTTNNPHLT